MLNIDREKLGQVVRKLWMLWAERQPVVKPSWVVPYKDLSDADQEADRMIGEGVANFVLNEQQEQGYRPIYQGNLKILLEVAKTYLVQVEYKKAEGADARNTIIRIEGACDEARLLLAEPMDEGTLRFKLFKAKMLDTPEARADYEQACTFRDQEGM